MLVLLRIIFGAAFFYVIELARHHGSVSGSSDTIGAGYVALGVIIAIANALVWAPYFGAKVSGPLTGMMTTGTYVERKNWLLHLIYWLQDRGFRRLTVIFCFLEGIHHPDRPTAFVIGFKNSGRGSWFEKVFAREVFRFDNIQHSLQAYEALQRHGVNPGVHRNPEINLVLRSKQRPARPDPQPIVIKLMPSETAPKRNPNIRLFQGGAASEAAKENFKGAEPSQEVESRGKVNELPSESAVPQNEAFETKAESSARRILQKIGAFLRGE